MDKIITIVDRQYRIFGNNRENIQFVELGWVWNSRPRSISLLQEYLQRYYPNTIININHILHYIDDFHWIFTTDCDCKMCRDIKKRKKKEINGNVKDDKDVYKTEV